jgi:hypothetical protein
VCHDVEQGPQDARSRTLEVGPEFDLRAALCVANCRQSQDDCPICEIRPADHILDAIEQHGSCRFKVHFGIIAVEHASTTRSMFDIAPIRRLLERRLKS